MVYRDTPDHVPPWLHIGHTHEQLTHDVSSVKSPFTRAADPILSPANGQMNLVGE